MDVNIQSDKGTLTVGVKIRRFLSGQIQAVSETVGFDSEGTEFDLDLYEQFRAEYAALETIYALETA